MGQEDKTPHWLILARATKLGSAGGEAERALGGPLAWAKLAGNGAMGTRSMKEGGCEKKRHKC